jgi:hypothetical protein
MSYENSLRLFRACYDGDFNETKAALAVGAVDEDQKAFRRACAYGYKDIVELLLAELPCFLNPGLLEACNGCNKSIVELLLSTGADDWNGGLYFAYRSSGEDRYSLLSMMLIAGASNAKSVFQLPRDSDLLVDLLTTMDVRRSSLATVGQIDEFVFARLDVLRNRFAAALDDVRMPAVLQRIVIQYCLND